MHGNTTARDSRPVNANWLAKWSTLPPALDNDIRWTGP